MFVWPIPSTLKNIPTAAYGVRVPLTVFAQTLHTNRLSDRELNLHTEDTLVGLLSLETYRVSRLWEYVERKTATEKDVHSALDTVLEDYIRMFDVMLARFPRSTRLREGHDLFCETLRRCFKMEFDDVVKRISL